MIHITKYSFNFLILIPVLPLSPHLMSCGIESDLCLNAQTIYLQSFPPCILPRCRNKQTPDSFSET